MQGCPETLQNIKPRSKHVPSVSLHWEHNPQCDSSSYLQQKVPCIHQLVCQSLKLDLQYVFPLMICKDNLKEHYTQRGKNQDEKNTGHNIKKNRSIKVPNGFLKVLKVTHPKYRF